MKKNKILLNAVLWLSCGFTLFSFSKENSAAPPITDEIQQAHHNQTLPLDSEHIRHCSQELNLLSSRVFVFKNEIFRAYSHCLSFETAALLEACVNVKRGFLQQIKNLTQSLADIQSRCTEFNSHFLLTQMESYIHSMELDFANTYSLYTKNFQRESSAQKIHRRLKYFQCSVDIRAKRRRMLDWENQVKTADAAGNFYIRAQGLSALKVLRDSIIIQAEICTAESVLENEDDKKFFAGIQETAAGAQNLYHRIISEFENEDLNLRPEKWCEFLKDELNIHLELCKEPVNSLSWAYSVHYQAGKIINEEK